MSPSVIRDQKVLQNQLTESGNFVLWWQTSVSLMLKTESKIKRLEAKVFSEIWFSFIPCLKLQSSIDRRAICWMSNRWKSKFTKKRAIQTVFAKGRLPGYQCRIAICFCCQEMEEQSSHRRLCSSLTPSISLKYFSAYTFSCLFKALSLLFILQ